MASDPHCTKYAAINDTKNVNKESKNEGRVQWVGVGQRSLVYLPSYCDRTKVFHS